MSDLRIRVNGVDLGTTYGWFPDGLPGWLDMPARTVAMTQLPSRYGGLASRLEAGSRDLGLAGGIQAATPEARDALEVALEQLLFSGLIRIEITEGTIRRWVEGYTRTFVPAPLNAGVPNFASRIDAVITCPDPLWRATAMTGTAITAPNTRVTLPLGSAASDPVIHLMGPSTNVVFALRDGRGEPIGVPLAFAVGLGTTEYLAIDMRRVRIDRVTAGVAVNGRSLLAAGTFPFPLDPRRGPLTAEVSGGTAQILYRRGWR